MEFMIVVVPQSGGRTTVFSFQEKYGDDLPHKLYKVEMRADVVTPVQRQRLAGVLRKLASSSKEGGVA
jgi:hypothetical protein